MLLAGCATPSSDAPSGVRAQKYRVAVFDGSLALARGASEIIDELYFPDQGVACNIEWAMTDTMSLAPVRLRAFPAPSTRVPSASEISEIVVPRDLAMAIVELASQQHELAKQALDAGLFLREPR